SEARTSGAISWPRTSSSVRSASKPSCSSPMQLAGSLRGSRSRVSWARRTGAVLELGVEVREIATAAGRVSGVSTSAGDISSAVVVNAAGPWAGVLAATAGVTMPLEPVPRHVLVTGGFPGAPERRTLVIDAATSFYFHREGTGVLMGMGSPTEHASFALTPDDAFVSEALLPTALRVFPPLEDAAIEHS